ncbi:unnamed protein product, partial [Ectocarpus sp. 4 AP-2014]
MLRSFSNTPTILSFSSLQNTFPTVFNKCDTPVVSWVSLVSFGGGGRFFLISSLGRNFGRKRTCSSQSPNHPKRLAVHERTRGLASSQPWTPHLIRNALPTEYAQH